jgi:plastocyanin
MPGTTVYVPVGTKVVWLNNDPYKQHGVQATKIQSQTYFGAGTHTIPYGQSYSVTFTTAGSYDYTTVYQPQLTGKIVVS